MPLAPEHITRLVSAALQSADPKAGVWIGCIIVDSLSMGDRDRPDGRIPEPMIGTKR